MCVKYIAKAKVGSTFASNSNVIPREHELDKPKRITKAASFERNIRPYLSQQDIRPVFNGATIMKWDKTHAKNLNPKFGICPVKTMNSAIKRIAAKKTSDPKYAKSNLRNIFMV